MMKLYRIEMKFRVFEHRKPLATLFMDIDGFMPSSAEGEWTVSKDDGRLFGRRRGYWQLAPSIFLDEESDIRQISITDKEMPGAISYIFGSGLPSPIARLGGILGFPLKLGETGTGAAYTVQPHLRGTNLDWRVINKFV
jgi:hypothetical protein